jgi:hypothetical protein
MFHWEFAFAAHYTQKIAFCTAWRTFSMAQFPIKFHSFQDIQRLATLAAEKSYRIQVSDGTHTVGAKSFLGIFCLNLHKELSLQAECTAAEWDQLLLETAYLAIQ